MNKLSHAKQFLLLDCGYYCTAAPIPFDGYTLIPQLRPRQFSSAPWWCLTVPVPVRSSLKDMSITPQSRSMWWTTHCLKPMGFLLRRPRNLLSPQALIRAVPALYYYFYAISLNPSSSIFFAALISLSWFVPQTGHIHSLTDRFFVSAFWYPQAEHNWLLA